MNTKSIVISVSIFALMLTGCSLFTSNIKTTSSTAGLTEQEARLIAGETCIKGGESLTAGSYNEGTKTWWFDANLNAVKEGCNPACVVSEETKTAEINWRCTGLITENEALNEELKKVFAIKYPKYTETLSVTINQQEPEHVRGDLIFEKGAPGGIFFAVKRNSKWEIVFEGNGQIPCTLSDYGFTEGMLSDCARK